jgi:hypothetical protein
MAAVEPEAVAGIVAAVFPMAGRDLPGPIPSAKLSGRGVLRLSEAGLTDAQFRAVCRAAERVGDVSLYLSYAERFVDPDRAQDFQIKTHDYNAYRASAPLGGLDHVLASPRSAWGVHVLNEGVAVVAGDDQFVASVYDDLPPAFDQAVAFVQAIRSSKHKGATSWVVGLIRDVLGSETAEAVLSAAR